MTFKGILFDLDGTLLDTIDDITFSLNAALAAHGYPVHDREAVKYFVGSGTVELCRRAMPAHATPAEVDAVYSDHCANYAVHQFDRTAPYAGIMELLDALRAAGRFIGVVSNKPDKATKELCELYFGRGAFFDVVGQRDGMPIKPDPTLALALAAETGLEPGQCVYLGDTGSDMELAVRAGFYPVGVLWGFRPERELREAGARELFGTPEELRSFLGV